MAYSDKQTDKNRNFKEALYHALAGWKVALVEERNLKIHLVISVLVIALATFLGFNQMEWLVLIMTIAAVVGLEMLNTLIENLVDLVTEKQFHPLAKKVKDVAAGLVLFASLVAVIIGIILFLPKLV
ncbi:diacylglycerol kinase family protein [Vagococcus coleopterorum]|uniref:Diacylglycerol kinase family protein n=1 Tax=Vagococcus coleopterorum TaxID=2714946 RepID=A0A6G8APN4_9ENTE|nr:diacylglycerol kinase family protein [Vagococcus coleopterorum]QIL46895.1 diacylglycerol kinase family protein [Vagococcus coleopterorum]